MHSDSTSMEDVTQLPSPNDRVVVRVTIPGVAPEAVFPYWTDPELLRLWWPQQAETDPRPGGSYHLSWPSMDWHLRGTYTAFEPPTMLYFTWVWDHSDIPMREVAVVFDPATETGTTITVTHGEYTDSPQDQDERQGHLEGWRSFLGKLREVVVHA